MVFDVSASVSLDARSPAVARRARLIILTTLAFSAATPLMAQQPGPQPAAAAAEAPSNTPQEVVVTGSRIARPDYKSDSPLVTVSSDALRRSSDVSIDQQLAKLPQFVPGANQITSAADVQPTSTNSPGIATVNLRGLGANRTLVLLDGRRTQPANATLEVDINTIPTPAIDSIEVITGGAAATYGADAVAGVVNFKLKKHFEGVTLDAQSGETTAGDGAQSQLSALIGSNFANDKGNAMVGLTYSRRNPVYAIDRSFYREGFTDPGTPGVNAFANFPGFNPSAGYGAPGYGLAGPYAGLQGQVQGGRPTQAAVDSVFAQVPGYVPGDVTSGSTLYFNTAPTTAGATLFSVNPGTKSGIAAPGYAGTFYPNYKLLSNGAIGSNAPLGYISLPITRYSAFAHAYYDVNENLELYIQSTFDQNETRTRSGASVPAFNQWSVTIPYDAAHPVPAALATILNSRTGTNAVTGAPNAQAPWVLYQQLNFMGPESLDTTTHTFEILAGAKGPMGLKDWTYDVFVSHGNTSQLITYHGFVDLANYTNLIDQPNYGAGYSLSDGRTGRIATCTSGLNPFLNTPVSQDCIDMIAANNQGSTNLLQNQAELDIQGGLFDLPAGELRFAVGADYRKDSISFQPDPANSATNVSTLTVGLFDTSPTSGSITVNEGYLELLAPLVKDLPLVKALNLDAGYRYSSYNTATGGVSTWKITGDWDVNGWLKLRGGRQVANRAPNVAELFLPPTFSTVPWADSDPCAINTVASWGNVPSNPNRAQVQALCTALAGGFPIGNTYTGNTGTFFPLGRDLQTGNPNLKSEKAETWTIGAVLQSPFDTALLRRLSMTVDYYDIAVNNAIAPATTAIAYQECFNAFGTNPNYDPNNAFCKLIARFGPGTATPGNWIDVNAQYQNLGSIKTRGIDVALDWSVDGPGMFGHRGAAFANVNFNYLLAYDVQPVAGGPVQHYANTIGSPISAPPFGAQFQWRLYTIVGYSIGPAAASIAWRHLPEVDNVSIVSNPNTKTLPTPSYDQFDLAASWSITEQLDVRAGVDNVFDKAPLRVGVTPGTTNAAGATDPAGSYDVLGRRFYVGVTARL